MPVTRTTPSAPVAGGSSDQSFDRIQGNILAPFNKPCVLFLFLNFRNSQQDARAWLTELVKGGFIASTSQVVEHGKERRKAIEEGREPEKLYWVGVSLTSSALVTLHHELATDLVTYDAFWRGALADLAVAHAAYPGERMASPALVGDTRVSDPSRWVIGGPGQAPVDALVTIAADDADDDGDGSVTSAAKIEQDRAKKHQLEVLEVRQGNGDTTLGQYGRRLEEGVEHFGFKDGISQPGIRGFTEETVRYGRLEAKTQPGTPIIAAGEFVLGYEREPGSSPDARRPEPPAWMRDGSFQVFLRLTQNVHGWRTQMTRLRASSKANVDVEARVIGRNKDGSPLASNGRSEAQNDFTYDDDPEGLKTPRFAHIRRMNLRDKGVFHRTRRVLRRGIPFGPAVPNGAPEDNVERGLLFNAFMASIEDKFEFLQRWASNSSSLPATPADADGPDPVTGTSDAPCFLRQDDGASQEIHFERFVRTSGAVYAFAPSIPTLGRLGGSQPMRGE
jgi:Dyp-type peroxidase family